LTEKALALPLSLIVGSIQELEFTASWKRSMYQLAKQWSENEASDPLSILAGTICRGICIIL